VGLGICYDSGFPEHARSAALDGCHVYAVGALFGVGGGEHQYKTWFPARALDNTSYVLLANHVGRAGQWRACGGSAVWSPDGRLIAEASPVDPGVVVVGLDPAVLKTVRGDLSMLADLIRSSSVPRRTELKN
jgi:predicted amidohydrolase